VRADSFGLPAASRQPATQRDGRPRLAATLFGFAGRVVKWQTRRLQVPVRATSWGFKSPLAHDLFSANVLMDALNLCLEKHR
jgi:hypothetical protein